jgi:hypothetical protein
MLALAYAVAPDTWSGYGGVPSGPPTPPTGSGTAGSGGDVGNPALNSGVQVVSTTVSALSSVSPCRIAVIGRQKL